MGILDKLLGYKFHILVALVLMLLPSYIFIMAPSFVTILTYFWPLLLSTALFLIAVVLFARASPPAADSSVDEAEGLLDYVAGHPAPQSDPEPEPESLLEPEQEPPPVGESSKPE